MRLVVIEPAGDAERALRPAVEVQAGAVLIGRDPACDLPLDDDKVSRHHVECRAEGDRLHVRDLGSRNGTYVNGRRVEQAVLLLGDELRVGRHLLRLDGGTAMPVAPATLTTNTPGAALTAVATVAATAGPARTARQLPRGVAIAIGACLLGLAGAMLPLLPNLWRGTATDPAPADPAEPPLPAAWRLLAAGDRAGAARRLDGASGDAAQGLRAWLDAGGGLPADRPGADGELAPLDRTLAAVDLPEALRPALLERRRRVQREVDATHAVVEAQALETDGRVAEAITAYDGLAAFADTTTAARHRGRAGTLRASLVRQFRTLGESNRAADDWDGALRCFRAARRWLEGDGEGLDRDLREAEREVAARAALDRARALAAAGEWDAARAAVAEVPPDSTVARRAAALATEIDRRHALAAARALYAAGEDGPARARLDPWRAEGDLEAAALGRRIGVVVAAFAEAEGALADRRYEAARAGWTTVLDHETDRGNAFHRRAAERLAAWPTERVAITLRAAGLEALEAGRHRDARDCLDRAQALHPAIVARERAELLLHAELLYNEALNLRRTDPPAARAKYRAALDLQRPGDPKYEATQRELARLGG